MVFFSHFIPDTRTQNSEDYPYQIAQLFQPNDILKWDYMVKAQKQCAVLTKEGTLFAPVIGANAYMAVADNVIDFIVVNRALYRDRQTMVSTQLLWLNARGEIFREEGKVEWGERFCMLWQWDKYKLIVALSMDRRRIYHIDYVEKGGELRLILEKSLSEDNKCVQVRPLVPQYPSPIAFTLFLTRKGHLYVYTSRGLKSCYTEPDFRPLYLQEFISRGRATEAIHQWMVMSTYNTKRYYIQEREWRNGVLRLYCQRVCIGLNPPYYPRKDLLERLRVGIYLFQGAYLLVFRPHERMRKGLPREIWTIILKKAFFPHPLDRFLIPLSLIN